MTFSELLPQQPDAKRQIPPNRDLPITQFKYSAGSDWGSQQGTGSTSVPYKLKSLQGELHSVLRVRESFTTPQLSDGSICNY